MPKEIDPNQQVTLTASDLLKLFSELQASQNKAQEKQAEVLAKAFAESRKPYEEPGQIENKRMAREQIRKQELGKLKNAKRKQKDCPHEQGQTGDERNGKSAFNFLKLPTGEWIGVCTYCQYVASSLRPSDKKFFQKRSGRPAEAGMPVIPDDPLSAQLARFSPDEQKEILKERKLERELVPTGVDG